MERLGGSDFETPAFIEEKLAKLRATLKEEERLLSVMRAEVTAREARVEVLRSALESADKKDWELVIGFETRLPRLPPRPPVRRTRRKPKVEESSRDPERSRKRKRSSSCPPVSGGRRPAFGRAGAEDESQSRTRAAMDRSRSGYREDPPQDGLYYEEKVILTRVGRYWNQGHLHSSRDERYNKI